MKARFKQPNPNGYMLLVDAMALNSRGMPILFEFDPYDPASARAAYEQAHSGPASGPTGGYFKMLMFLSNVEGRMGYAPGALTSEEPFEKILDRYWSQRCRHVIAAQATPTEAPAEEAPAPTC
jgi:hypothetical protein